MIGLLGADLQWQGLLAQEGVAFRTRAVEILDRLAVLILDRAAGDDAESIRRFVEAGGCVLGSAAAGSRIWTGFTVKRRNLTCILPDRTKLFRNVGPVHVNCEGHVSSHANHGSDQKGRPAVFVAQIGRGMGVFLPFECSELLARTGSASRRFYARARKQVLEHVSLVSRGEVRRLVANCLRLLLSTKGFPYVRLSCVPGPERALFGFRIDTDTVSSRKFSHLSRLAREVGMKFTCFIHTGSNRERLEDALEVLSGQDVQLHCFRHQVFRDHQSNLDNLGQGVSVLKSLGFEPSGAAAPYGDWNPEWNRALERLRFLYSSDFASGYDDLPFRPILDGAPSSVLQVPVHPVSPGLLFASRSEAGEMVDYYRRQVELQAARGEPCFLFGHPADIHRFGDGARGVLRYGVSVCGSWSTLSDYARWWARREQVRYCSVSGGDSIRLDVDAGADSQFVRVDVGQRQAVLELKPGRFHLAALRWRAIRPPVRFPAWMLAAARGRHWTQLAGRPVRSILKNRFSRRSS